MDKLPKYSGWIEIICGPMFSGKTEELIKRITRIKIANQSVVIIKPITDNRYSEEFIVSHNKRKIKCTMVKEPKEILNVSRNHDVIGIDEVQFFDNTINTNLTELNIKSHGIFRILQILFKGIVEITILS